MITQTSVCVSWHAHANRSGNACSKNNGTLQNKIYLGECVLLILSVLLHRQNAELETLNANIQTEKEHLREQNTHLTQRLEAVAQPPTPVHGINADTPLDLMLNVLQKLIMVSNFTITLFAPKLTMVDKHRHQQIGTPCRVKQLACHRY